MKTSRRVLIAVLTCAFTFPTLRAAGDRIQAPIDPSRVARLSRHVHPRANASNDRGAMPAGTELRDMALLIKPGPGLEQLLASQRDPQSTDFRRWLTPEEFGIRFGLSSPDLEGVTEWLRSQGLRPGPAARGRHWLSFSGTAERVGRAFRTQMRRYESDGEMHYANATDPSIPEALAGIVEMVDGLNDFAPKPMSIVRPQQNVGGSHYLAPEDFATIYNLKPLFDAGIDGTGQSVVVIGQTSIELPDIRLFRSQFGLPASDPQLVLFGTDPGARANDQVEAALDVEWAGATAPGAKVIYAYAGTVTTALLNAVDQNLGPVITMSYGGCEQAFPLMWRYVVQQANAQGITVLVASGDAGGASCDFTAVTPQASKGATVTWPAGIPEITAVGGTQFDEGAGAYWAAANSAKGGSALSYIPEIVWNESAARNALWATGGGASGWYAKPSWQFGPGVPDDNARDVPDISFSASVQHVAYTVIAQGRTLRVGGTSASSPAFAGALAVLNHYLMSRGVIGKPGLGNINPMLYRLAQAAPEAFHDVTGGDNKVPCAQGTPRCLNGLVGFDAGQGYDQATGLGSADLHKLITSWSTATATKVTVTASNDSPALNDILQLTATVQPAGSGTPTGSVTFATAFGLIGSAPLVDSGGVSTATVSAKAIQIAGTTGLVAATYSGDRVFDSASGATAINVAMPAGGSAVIPVITPNPVHQIGTTWLYTIQLVEKNGVATRLTGFTVNGVVNSVSTFFGSGQIPAKGTITASLSGSLTTFPVDRVFVFTGEDAGGTQWQREITVPFLGPAGAQVRPGITLTATPGTVQQDAAANVACQWRHQLTVTETGGYFVQLTSLSAAPDDLSSRIAQLFGTVRLAPYGSLSATVCWDVLSPSRTFQIAGTPESGATVTASATVSFRQAAAAPAGASTDLPWPVMYLSPPAVENRTFRLALDGGRPQWSARILPPNRTSDWLSVTPVSGTGTTLVTIQADSAGLSPGAYFATVALQATDALPQYLTIPVTLVVGADSSISIGGISNNFSGTVAFAPGMLASVYGSGLSPSTQFASRLPLPLTMQGVSATVNGIAAPLYHVLPQQIDLQIPYEAGIGPAVLAVNNNGKVAAFPIQIAANAPGLSAPGGTLNVSGKPGETLVIWATGEGDVTPTIATGATPASGTAISRLPQPRQPVNVTVGGAPAQIAFAGIPAGVAGVMQINFIVPEVAAGPQPLVLTVGGVPSQAVTLNVRE
jgi:uncharacterized protein (TIGR03437 family)